MSALTLPDRLGTTWRLLVKELSAFGVVGIFSMVVDLGVFQVLYAHLGVGAITARLCSTVISATVAYFAHRYWSFSHRARTGVKREYVLFFLINGATTVLNLAIVGLVRYPLHQDSSLVLQVANIASIALGTILRYFAYRKWVFVAHDHPAAVNAQAAEDQLSPAA